MQHVGVLFFVVFQFTLIKDVRMWTSVTLEPDR